MRVPTQAMKNIDRYQLNIFHLTLYVLTSVSFISVSLFCQTVVKGRWQPTHQTVIWTFKSSVYICRETESKLQNTPPLSLNHDWQSAAEHNMHLHYIITVHTVWPCSCVFVAAVQTKLVEEALHWLCHLHCQAGHQGTGEDEKTVTCQSSSENKCWLNHSKLCVHVFLLSKWS